MPTPPDLPSPPHHHHRNHHNNRHRQRLRSLLLLNTPPPPPPPKKMTFPFGALGCTSASSHAISPSSSTSASAAAAAVRSSADWPLSKPSRSNRNKKRGSGKERDKEKEKLVSSNCVVTSSDVWCAVDSSVDCVPPLYHRSSRPDRPPPREDGYAGRMDGGEDLLRLSSFLDDPQSPEAPLFGIDGGVSRHVHRSRRIRRSPGGLDELMMFQARILLGEMDVHDRYRDLRLDVDNMSYEELLELGDRIGHVNTGLGEEEILRCLRKMKHTIFTASSLQFSSELERKCSICQEEYEINDEVAKVACGHGYHTYCIKQWLLRKNACPVCKATVSKS